MPITLRDSADFSRIPSLQFVLPVVASDPDDYEAGLIYNATEHLVKYHDGTDWVALGGVSVDEVFVGPGTPPVLQELWVDTDEPDPPATGGGGPTGAAGGDLTGFYPDPQIAPGAITDADIDVSANIAQSKIAGLIASLAGKTDTTRNLVAGSGLAGGGNLTADRSFDVGQGVGISVAADAVSLDTAYTDGRYALKSAEVQEVFVGPTLGTVIHDIWIDTDEPDPSIMPMSVFYKHTQSALATVWTVEHRLGFHPAVHMEDAAGSVMFGSIRHVSDDVLTITFRSAITGNAYCS